MQAGAASHAVKSEVPCHRNSALKPSSYLQDSCKSGRSKNGRDGAPTTRDAALSVLSAC